MTPTTSSAIDVDALWRRLAASPDGDRLRPVVLRRIVAGEDALDRLPKLLGELIGRGGGPIAILRDATPKRRDGADLTGEVERLLDPVGELRIVEVGPPDGHAHADEQTVAAACDAALGAAGLVTVGSGTVADIGKVVAATLEGAPHAVVQTAASVNGFADDRSVLLRQGVKRTVASRWPDLLVLDTATLAAAPAAMTRAGFGDLISTFTAPADWYLASALGMDEPWLPSVVSLVRERGEQLLALAPRLGAADPAAVDELAEILALSGISMGVAGRTSPSSGMEHTVSHMLEMAAGIRGTPAALHGATVGVATIVAALTWRRVRRRLPDLDPLSVQVPPADDLERRLRATFDALDPSGAMAAECWSDYQRKLERWTSRPDALAALLRDWERHAAVLDELLVEPERLAAALAETGAPRRFGELQPAVDPATARWAMANCHLVRERFTVADLAFLVGMWTAADVDAVCAEAAALGAGL